MQQNTISTCACWCNESIDTDFLGEPGLERREKCALLVTLSPPGPPPPRGPLAEPNAGIEVVKSSMDIEFWRDNGVAHRDPPEFWPLPTPIRDRGLLNQEESWY